MKSIILMGIKHCGKSTQARLLGKEFKMPVYDTDNLIEDETGLSPRELYTQKGELAFKDAETVACVHLKEKLSETNSDAVIATGGGICNNPDALDVLKSIGTCIFLKADEKIAVERILKEAVVSEDGSIRNLPAYIAKKNPCSLDEVREASPEEIKQMTTGCGCGCDCGGDCGSGGGCGGCGGCGSCE